MTIVEMRALVGLPEGTSDAEVVAAYAALIGDGLPASIALVEPVTVEQAKIHCKIEEDNEDILIAQKIRTAREFVEDYTSRIIAQRTLVAHFRNWGSCLELFSRPIISVDAIAYNGTDDDEIYVGAAFARGTYPLRIFPGASAWPSLRAGGGITVAYTAGYDPEEVPNCMFEAIYVLVFGMMSARDGAYERSVKAAEALLFRLTATLI